MINRKRQNLDPHPLEPIILSIAAKHHILDVPLVASELSGGGFGGRDATKGTRAYRIVAADVLGCMAGSGRLEQIGDWVNPRCKDKGGASFILPTAPQKGSDPLAGEPRGPGWGDVVRKS